MTRLTTDSLDSTHIVHDMYVEMYAKLVGWVRKAGAAARQKWPRKEKEFLASSSLLYGHVGLVLHD